MTIPKWITYVIFSGAFALSLSATPVLNLGNDYNLVIYSNAGATAITNNLGSSFIANNGVVAGPTETGFSAANFVSGHSFATTDISTYNTDFLALFNNESAGCTSPNVCSVVSNPTTLTAGYYQINSFANSVTLNGSATDVFFLYFNLGGVNFSATDTVILGPNVDPNNVFEFVPNGVNFNGGGNYTFSGTLVTAGAVNMNSPLALNGRVLTKGKVTINPFGGGTVTVNQGGLVVVPEPSTLTFTGVALIGLVMRRRLRVLVK